MSWNYENLISWPRKVVRERASAWSLLVCYLWFLWSQWYTFCMLMHLWKIFTVNFETVNILAWRKREKIVVKMVKSFKFNTKVFNYWNSLKDIIEQIVEIDLTQDIAASPKPPPVNSNTIIIIWGFISFVMLLLDQLFVVRYLLFY